MLIDTHCHLDFEDFDRDRDDVIDRAKDASVGGIINVGSSIEGTRRSIELSKKYDIVYASIGVHPHEANSVTDAVIEEFRRLSMKKKVVAIGEVGLDYHRNLSPKESQQMAFRKFIHLAQELGLPLIFHSREANDEIFDILKEYEPRLSAEATRAKAETTNHACPPKPQGRRRKPRIRGVMHCFSGDKNFLKECLDMGLYVSFTCNLTFKNAENLREVAREMPVERLLLETDAPFLAPQEFRGRRNEPSYLVYLVDEWAKILGLSKNDIIRITTHNANSLFKLGLEESSKIAYEIRDSLYLNITNRCTNECDFCERLKMPFVKGHNLKLDKEPSIDEVLRAIGDPKRYKEIVFCGYGEPTARLDLVKAVSKELKKHGARIRLVTNGHGDIINSRPCAKELVGLIDKVSVSLNADRESAYNDICKPTFGPGTYKRVLDFIRDCVVNNIDTEITCLNLPSVDTKKCEEIAKSLGAKFRLRLFGVTG